MNGLKIKSLAVCPLLIFAGALGLSVTVVQTVEAQPTSCIPPNTPDVSGEGCIDSAGNVCSIADQFVDEMGGGYCSDSGPGAIGGEQFGSFTRSDTRPMCNGVPGVSVSPSTDPDGCIEFNEDDPTLENNPIFIILRNVVQFLLISVGVALVAVVIVSGYQYIFARGNPQQTSAARDRIGYAIGGLIMFAIASLLMNWLVPGGVI